MTTLALPMILVSVLGTACALDDSPDELGSDTQAIVGGYTTNARPEVGFLAIGAGCTGTLISPRVVLTAAHCLSPAYTGSTYAPAGSYFRITDVNKVTHDYAVDFTLSFHPEGDVAVAHLTTSVAMSLAVPATMALTPPSVGAQSTVYGYGCNSSAGTGGGVKRWTYIAYGQTTTVLCPGDSGGPATFGYVGGSGAIWGINVSHSPDRFAPIAHLVPQIEAAKRQWDGNAEVGYDRPGMDFAHTSAGSAEICNQYCDANARCQAWSFVPSTLDCYLKDGVPDPIASSMVTSGLVRPIEGGFDRPGYDFERDSNVGSAAECAHRCTESEYFPCKAFTYVASTKVCWMKTAVPPRVPNPDCSSGTPHRMSEVGYDRPGGDLSSLASPSLDDCEWRCAYNASCRAYVFSASRQMCWLKSEVTPAIASSDLTSGVRRGVIVGTSLIGNVIDSFYVTVPSWPTELSNSPSSASVLTCQTACRHNVFCHAWTLTLDANNGGQCALMDAPTTSHSNRAISGYRYTEFAP